MSSNLINAVDSTLRVTRTVCLDVDCERAKMATSIAYLSPIFVSDLRHAGTCSEQHCIRSFTTQIRQVSVHIFQRAGGLLVWCDNMIITQAKITAAESTSAKEGNNKKKRLYSTNSDQHNICILTIDADNERRLFICNTAVPASMVYV